MEVLEGAASFLRHAEIRVEYDVLGKWPGAGRSLGCGRRGTAGNGAVDRLNGAYLAQLLSGLQQYRGGSRVGKPGGAVHREDVLWAGPGLFRFHEGIGGAVQARFECSKGVWSRVMGCIELDVLARQYDGTNRVSEQEGSSSASGRLRRVSRRCTMANDIVATDNDLT